MKEAKEENGLLVAVDSTSYPIEQSKILQIQEAFVPKWAEKEEVEKDLEVFKKLFKKEGVNEQTVEEAKALAKKAQKVRTSTKKIHEVEKAFYLQGGRLVDAFNNAIKKPIEEHEDYLKEITEYEKRMEEERLAKLQKERVEILSKYVEDAEERKLNEMDDEMWEAYLHMQKTKYDERVAEEKKAQKEEEERQRLVKLHNDRKEQLIPYWNFLSEDKKSLNFSEVEDEDFATILDTAKGAKESDDKKKAALEKEAEELRKKEGKRKARSIEMSRYSSFIDDYDTMIEMKDAEYKKALDEAVNASELKAEQDRKAEEERITQEEAEKAAKTAPDKEKLEALVENINGLEMPELSSEGANEILDDVQTLLGKVVKYINEEKENI